MTIVPKKKSDSRSAQKSNVVPKKDQEHQEHLEHQHNQDSHRRSPRQCSSTRPTQDEDVDYSGYNSGDEHNHDRQPSYMQWTEQEFQEKELQFEKKINKKGWVIKKMAEDGACLFRAVADQIYGDQDMHSVLRKLCIDYIAKNSDYFSQYVTEDFGEYLKRKSLDHSHGNHIEIQAMSEMFNRPIEVYHYTSEPINIFQGQTNDNEPIRLSYHRSVHYNSIVDPFKATVGVGLGLPAYDPGIADKSLLEKAIRLSDEDAIEKAMLEDKLLATDWEATNEAIEEQVARESYLEWLRENESRFHKKFKKSSSPQPTTAAAAATCSNYNSSTPPPSSSKYVASQHHHHNQHHDHHQQQQLQYYNNHQDYYDDNLSSSRQQITIETSAGCSSSAVSACSTSRGRSRDRQLYKNDGGDLRNDNQYVAMTSSSFRPSSPSSSGSTSTPRASPVMKTNCNYKSSSPSGDRRGSPRASSSRDIL